MASITYGVNYLNYLYTINKSGSQIHKTRQSGGGGGGKHTIDARIDAMSARSLALCLPFSSFLRATNLRIGFAIKAASGEMKDITQDQQQQLQR